MDGIKEGDNSTELSPVEKFIQNPFIKSNLQYYKIEQRYYYIEVHRDKNPSSEPNRLTGSIWLGTVCPL